MRALNHHDLQEFTECIRDDIIIITKALQQRLVVPDWRSFVDEITDIYNVVRDVEGGEVATYIPELAKADPKKFGVSVCTIDGQR